MREEEYILVSDLARVRDLMATLREIVPANNTEIDEDSYRFVWNYLIGWEKRISNAITID